MQFEEAIIVASSMPLRNLVYMLYHTNTLLSLLRKHDYTYLREGPQTSCGALRSDFLLLVSRYMHCYSHAALR